VNFPAGVWEYDQLRGGVRSIGVQAFQGCTSLAAALLPECVKDIGEGAFWQCPALRDVNLPRSVFYTRSTSSSGSYEFSEYDGNDGWYYYYSRDLSDVFGDSMYVDGGTEYRRAWETVVVGDGVRSVPDYAFGELQNLRTVVLPPSVRSIGSSAFAWCPKLESVTIADGVRPQNNGEDWEIGSSAFANCASLKRVDIPDGVKYIRSGAFSGCTSLADVTLPDSVMYIESQAFWNCSSLKGVNFPAGVWEYDQLRGGVRSIGVQAFQGCTSLAAALLPECVKDIGDEAFAQCPSLRDVVLPRSVFYTRSTSSSGGYEFSEYEYDSQGSRTYYYYTSRHMDCVFHLGELWDSAGNNIPCAWETVVVGDGVRSVGGFTEYGSMPNLRTVVLPASVRSIGGEAFRNCLKLESVTIADGVRPQNYNNENWAVGMSAFNNCRSLKRVDIPEGVKYIRNEAFYNCTSLTDVTLPDSVMDIEYEAFYGCTSLTDVTLPDSVMYIQDSAFRGCRGLVNVTIPSGVVEIGTSAFAECSSLMSVKFMGNAPEIVDDLAFGNVAENCTAYVLPDSTGWGVGAGETWKGLRLMYWYYAGFPLVENDADVIVAMAGSADGRLASMITNVVEYYAYWDWAHAVKNKVGEFAGTSAVKASSHAASAYLLGATELFDNEPTIMITAVTMGGGEASATSSATGEPPVVPESRGGAKLNGQSAPSASMTVSVVVKDGERAVAVDPAKVAAMFEATSDLRDWDGAAKLTPVVETLEGDGATMRFRVTPGDGTAPSAFLRIRK